MVSYCLPHGLVVHVQFWSSPDPMGAHRVLSSPPKKCCEYVSQRPNYSLILLNTLLSCACTSLVQSKCPGDPEGGIV